MPELKTKTQFFDCHIHTEISHDSSADTFDICRSAIEKGISGIAFTDHCDIELYQTQNVVSPIKRSVDLALEASEKFAGKLRVFKGVEIGEAIYCYGVAQAVLENDFDIVLGSVHSIRHPKVTEPYSRIDFSKFSGEQIYKYLNFYFEDVMFMLESCDFDVLTHLTCPLRYIVLKYGFKVDMSRYESEIKTILKTVIDKNLSLEINTSSFNSGSGFLMPDTDIIKKYRDLGGHMITLGSDAHIPQRVGADFELAVNQLKELGFSKAFYYENRKPIAYEF